MKKLKIEESISVKEIKTILKNINSKPVKYDELFLKHVIENTISLIADDLQTYLAEKILQDIEEMLENGDWHHFYFDDFEEERPTYKHLCKVTPFDFTKNKKW